MADPRQAENKPEASKEEKAFRKRVQELLLPLALGAGLTVLAAVLHLSGALDGLQRLSYDALFGVRHRLRPDLETAMQDKAATQVAIVEYDEHSKALLRIKGAPPKRFFSKLLQRTTGLAKVVGFDYYFPRQAYPDSRTEDIEKNVRSNGVKLLGLFEGIQTGGGGEPRGMDGFSEGEYLRGLGFFDVSPEAFQGLSERRVKAFLEEAALRQRELAGGIRKGEEVFDATVRALDPALVNGLEGGGGELSLAARKLSGTVVNTLLLEDLNFGVKILFAQNVVLAHFISEGGFSVQRSDPLFQAAAHGEGLINAVKDVDGRMRSVPLVSATSTEFEFALSLASVVTAFDIQPGEVAVGADGRAGKFVLPDNMTLSVNYIGGPGSIRYIPLYRFLHDEITPEARAAFEAGNRKVEPPVSDEEIRGRVLLVGDTTSDGQDFVATPVSRLADVKVGEAFSRTESLTLAEMPGVEIHANAVFNILNHTWLRRPDPWALVLLLAALGTACLLFYWSRMGFLISSALLVLLTGGAFASAYVAFVHARSVFPVVPVLAVIGLNFVAGVAYQGIREQMKKKAVTSMFGKYVSENLVKRMVSGELEVVLEGRKKVLTVLFSDIRGFTTLSEGLDPEAVAYILRTYFTRMIGKVFENGGTLDKLMGDAVMAFFGDPEDMPDHPAHACETTIGMLEALEDLKKNSGIPGMEKINIGIGLNTGAMTVGNLGSGEYFSYTVIGDNVNFGSRLEGLNKNFGTNILVSASTRDPVADRFEFRRLGRVTVVGKTLPVVIYELLGRKGTISAEKAKVRDLFEAGLELWTARKFAEAAAKFEEALKVREDGPSKVYLQLAQHYLEEPPPPDWNAAFVPKGK